MPIKVAPILAELRQDHRNMARLLSLLEQQSEAIFDEETSDLERMVDIMHYLTVYSDAVHHPKEDRLYAELRAARPDLSQGMGRVCDEHHTLSLQSAQLRDKLVEANSGNFVRRKEIVADALRYVGSLREHMRWEESDLFRRLDVMVAEGHDEIESSTLVDHRDPLFGATIEARFKALFDAIGS
ncbi:MAG TPA: hemerythrin domain-containing protein [Woeseiaceae bacterium]|nr:hemerythrin domain-containing protein [Woeseiaceae bacterium]